MPLNAGKVKQDFAPVVVDAAGLAARLACAPLAGGRARRGCQAVFISIPAIAETWFLERRAWLQLADELSAAFPPELASASLRALPRRLALDLLLGRSAREVDETEKLMLLDRHAEYTAASLLDLSPRCVRPAARSLIAAIHAAGIRVVCATTHRNAGRALGRLGVGGWFDAHLPRGAHLWPSADLLRTAARALGTAAHHCVMIDTCPAPLTGAAAAGFRTIGVSLGRDLPAERSVGGLSGLSPADLHALCMAPPAPQQDL